MLPGRRRYTLPRVPLDFADRTRLPPGDVAGAGILTELPHEVAPRVWTVLRLVLDFAGAGPADAWFDAADLRAWEEELLRSSLEPTLRAPLAVLVGELADRARTDRGVVAHACWCVVEWATGRYEETALAFAEAAALAWPEHGRYAMVAGRLFRKAGRTRDAELWLRRARRLSMWAVDRETVVLSTSSLAMLFWERGNYRRSSRLLKAAERDSRRQGLGTLRGEVLHNRLVLAIDTGDVAAAIRYAEGAFERYLPNHPKLPALAYDIASLWLRKGFAHRALRIFRVLPPHFHERDPQLQLLAATAKAAGVMEDRDAYEGARVAFRRLADDAPNSRVLAAALVELAEGAISMGDEADGAEALRQALEIARSQSQSDVALTAERVLAELGTGVQQPRGRSSGETARLHDGLADRFVTVLQHVHAQP